MAAVLRAVAGSRPCRKRAVRRQPSEIQEEGDEGGYRTTVPRVAAGGRTVTDGSERLQAHVASHD